VTVDEVKISKFELCSYPIEGNAFKFEWHVQIFLNDQSFQATIAEKPVSALDGV
jgi:hypothetical protein